LSRDLQLNCVISFFFRLHLVLHACAARFDVTDTVALFGFTFRELNRLQTKGVLDLGVGPLLAWDGIRRVGGTIDKRNCAALGEHAWPKTQSP
jgi:hypothetical protein